MLIRLIVIFALASQLHAARLQEIAEASYNPFEYAQTKFMGGVFFKPLIGPFASSQAKKGALSYLLGVSAEIPLLDNLDLGFGFYLTRGYAKETLAMIDASFNFKPHLEIPIPYGHLNYYVFVALGPSAYMGQPPTGKGLTHTQGGGFNCSAATGFDYFVTPYLGFFVEGSYRYSAIFQRYIIKKPSDNYTGFQIHGASLNFGLTTTF